MDKEYIVSVIRTGYGTADIKIKGADSEEDAKKMALAVAGDHEYNEHGADYEIDGVLRIQEDD